MKHNFTIVSGSKLKKSVDIIHYIGALCDDDLHVEKAIVYEGDLNVDGNLTADFFYSLNEEADFFLLKGNLTISGDFNPDEETFPNMLILGNLKATNFQNGEELVAVSENATIENLLCGRYSHGGLKVDGKTTAKYVINEEHLIILPNLKADFVIAAGIVDEEENNINYTLSGKFLLEKVNENLITEGDYYDSASNSWERGNVVDVDLLIEQIKQNKEVFK